MNKEIESLFREAKVVSLEQIQHFMGKDNERFWNGMLKFLADKGFDIIPCRREGEQLQSEIYVAFDRFESEFPEPEPTISLSEPASQNSDAEIIKEWALNLAKTVHKGWVELSQYGKDGFKLFFSQILSLSYEEKKKRVLQKLSEELHIRFEELKKEELKI